MPQSVFDAGDPITSRLKLGITPDGSTIATPVVQRPDGTVITGLIPSPWEGAAGDEKTVQWFATDDGVAGSPTTEGVADGDWLVVWTVTGTGASVTPKVYSVRPLPTTSTRPPWMPFLSDVADYVPYLTLDSTIPGAQTFLGTFTGNTVPTDEQAQRHINRITGPMQERWPDLPDTLYRSARSYVSLRAAANILRAFGRTSEDRAESDRLSTEADTLWASLSDSADSATSSPSGTGQVPVWAFPTPVAWGDDYI